MSSVAAPRLPLITETKTSLSGRRWRFECRLVERDVDHAVVLFVSEEDRTVGGLRLPRGTITLAYFWADRPYNVYHWLDSDGHSLGFYFNLADHTVIGPELAYRDLEVDLLVTSDGRVQVLDEDCLPADLDAALRARITHDTQTLRSEAPTLVAGVEAESQRLWPLIFGGSRP